MWYGQMVREGEHALSKGRWTRLRAMRCLSCGLASAFLMAAGRRASAKSGEAEKVCIRDISGDARVT